MRMSGTLTMTKCCVCSLSDVSILKFLLLWLNVLMASHLKVKPHKLTVKQSCKVIMAYALTPSKHKSLWWCLFIFSPKAADPNSQAYIPKRHTLIQELPPANAYTKFSVTCWLIFDIHKSLCWPQMHKCKYTNSACRHFLLLQAKVGCPSFGTNDPMSNGTVE